MALSDVPVLGKALDGLRQRQLIEDLDDKFQSAVEARRNYEGQWLLNWAFFNGHQWHFYSKSRRTLFKPKVPSWRVLHVTNLVMPNALTEYAKLVQQRPVPFARPQKSDKESVDQARACDDVLEYLRGVDGSEDAELRSALWGIITGTALDKAYWDKDASDLLVEPDETFDEATQQPVPNPKAGQPIMDETKRPVHLGEVSTMAISPFEFYPQPLAETIDEMRWAFHVRVRTPEYVFDKYGINLEAEDVTNEEHLDAQMAAIAADDQSGQRKGVLVKEFWERSSAKHAQGRYVVYVRGKVLHVGENPYENAPLPFTAYQHVPNPGHFWGQSKITQAIDPQRNYNKARSQQIEYRNLLLKGKVLIPESAGINRELTSAPGEQIRYQGTAKPEFWTPPNMPDGYWKDMLESRSEIEDVFGLHEPSQGKNPAGVNTATGLALLQESDDLRMGPTLQSRENAIAAMASLKLALVRQFYTEPRTVRVVGQDQRVRVRAFRTKDIPDKVDVQIKAGSTLPRSRIARQEFVRGLINDEIIDKSAGLRLMELGDIDGLYDEQNLDIAHAERENERLKAGEMVEPEKFHNHVVHRRIHDRYRKSEEYETADEIVRATFEAHDQRHEFFLLTQPPPPAPTEPDGITPQDETMPPPGPSGPLGEAMASLGTAPFATT